MSIPPALVQFWASKDAPKLRDNNPMLYLYGDKDMTGKKQSKFFYDEVLVANPPKSSPLQKLDQTFLREIKGGGTLAGAALLGQNAKIGNEDTIVKFLDAIQKNRAKIVRKNRGYSSPYFLDLRAFGFAAP
jgi:hypothetical protein